MMDQDEDQRILPREDGTNDLINATNVHAYRTETNPAAMVENVPIDRRQIAAMSFNTWTFGKGMEAQNAGCRFNQRAQAQQGKMDEERADRERKRGQQRIASQRRI
ncbi:hypothetical protein QIS74_04933 [Colletotrichum tabaci]|uniref:Uncharacterized protein n=1 Tax=Colletotrichum tabaci TaxID=1209068 RepID=A0AAV9THE0_9PEZI